MMSLLHRESVTVHLNYAILLYNHGERGPAVKQFQLFKSKSQKYKPANPDPEVYTCRIGYTLQELFIHEV